MSPVPSDCHEDKARTGDLVKQVSDFNTALWSSDWCICPLVARHYMSYLSLGINSQSLSGESSFSYI